MARQRGGISVEVMVGPRRRIAAGAVTMCLLACNPADSASSVKHGQGGEQFRSSVVEMELDAAESLLRTRGFVPTGRIGRGFMPQGAVSSYELVLEKDRCHVVLTASSATMEALALELYSAEGTVVAESRLMGRNAALRYCPPHPGVHYLVIEASRGVGLFEARTYAGPTGLDVRLDDLFREERETEAAVVVPTSGR